MMSKGLSVLGHLTLSPIAERAGVTVGADIPRGLAMGGALCQALACGHRLAGMNYHLSL